MSTLRTLIARVKQAARSLVTPNLEALSVYILIAYIVGGTLAALLLQPTEEPGPVRIMTYVVFGVASTLLAYRYLRLIRRSDDGRSNVFIVCSAYAWIGLSLTFYFVTYIQISRAINIPIPIDEIMQYRISYFFISGAAIAVLFKALTFSYVEAEKIMSHRIPAWPLTLRRKRRRR